MFPPACSPAVEKRNDKGRRPIMSPNQDSIIPKHYHMIPGTFITDLWINVADRMGASAFAPNYVLQRPPRRQHRQNLVYRRDAFIQANKDINNNPMALKTRQ